MLHVASPFPSVQPRNPFELIVPARQGALRVLRAARDAGVVRVVLTSSFAAIGYGHAPTERLFTEEDWTELDDAASPYVRSKTLAERAAWDFVTSEGGALELAVVNPVGVVGPVVGPDLSSSIRLVKQALDGAMPAAPHLYFNVVDVRDVAELHLRAMIDPAARGERFLAVAAARCRSRTCATCYGRTWVRPPRACRPGRCRTVWCGPGLVNPEARGIVPGIWARCAGPATRRPGGCSAGSRARTKRESWRRRRVWCGWGWSGAWGGPGE